jgi:hypothetical protein
MAEYTQVEIVKIARPDTPEGYMIINAAQYVADRPASEYAQGLYYDPAVWKPYVEPVLKAPVEEHAPASSEPEARAGMHVGPASHRTSASEKK